MDEFDKVVENIMPAGCFTNPKHFVGFKMAYAAWGRSLVASRDRRIEELERACREMDSALVEFGYKVPKYPGLSSHAMIPVHETPNFWDKWQGVDKAWDGIRSALSAGEGSRKQSEAPHEGEER